MTTVTREHLAGLELALASGAITSPDMRDSVRTMISQAIAAPVKTTSDQYRAELYDEMFEKARSMGFGNIIGALKELERMKASAAPEQEAAVCAIHAKGVAVDHHCPLAPATEFESYLPGCATKLYTHRSAEIERLRAENERLTLENDGHNQRRIRNRAETKRLRAELEESQKQLKNHRANTIAQIDAHAETRQKLAEAQALLRESFDELDKGPSSFSKVTLRNRIHAAIPSTAQPADTEQEGD